MNVIVAAAVFAASLTVPASVAFAGTDSGVLLGVTGKVLVNDGKGYRAFMPAITIQSGYDIFVAAGASATVHFNEANCEVTLAAPSVTHISGGNMCQQATLENPVVQSLRGADEENVVITPTNGTFVAAAPAVAGEIPPYFIAAGIFTIGAAAFTEGMLQKDTVDPISGP